MSSHHQGSSVRGSHFTSVDSFSDVVVNFVDSQVILLKELLKILKLFLLNKLLFSESFGILGVLHKASSSSLLQKIRISIIEDLSGLVSPVIPNSDPAWDEGSNEPENIVSLNKLSITCKGSSKEPSEAK